MSSSLLYRYVPCNYCNRKHFFVDSDISHSENNAGNLCCYECARNNKNKDKTSSSSVFFGFDLFDLFFSNYLKSNKNHSQALPKIKFVSERYNHIRLNNHSVSFDVLDNYYNLANQNDLFSDFIEFNNFNGTGDLNELNNPCNYIEIFAKKNNNFLDFVFSIIFGNYKNIYDFLVVHPEQYFHIKNIFNDLLQATNDINKFLSVYTSSKPTQDNQICFTQLMEKFFIVVDKLSSVLKFEFNYGCAQKQFNKILYTRHLIDENIIYHSVVLSKYFKNYCLAFNNKSNNNNIEKVTDNESVTATTVVDLNIKTVKQNFIEISSNKNLSSFETKFLLMLNDIARELIIEYNYIPNVKLHQKINGVEVDVLVDDVIGFELNGLLYHSANRIMANKYDRAIGNASYNKIEHLFNNKTKVELYNINSYDFNIRNIHHIHHFVKSLILTNLYYQKQSGAVCFNNNNDNYQLNKNYVVKVVKHELSEQLQAQLINKICSMKNTAILIDNLNFKINKHNHRFVYCNDKIVAVLLKTNVINGNNFHKNNYQIVFVDGNEFLNKDEQFVSFIVDYIKQEKIQLVINNNYQTSFLVQLKLNIEKQYNEIVIEYMPRILSCPVRKIEKAKLTDITTTTHDFRRKFMNKSKETIYNFVKNNKVCVFNTCGYSVVFSSQN